MNENEFRDFLQSKNLTDKAINSRVTRAYRIEREFGVNLNEIVSNDDMMIDLRSEIYNKYGNRKSLPGNLYNSVCQYYEFRNEKTMIRVNQYIKKKNYRKFD